MPGHSLKREREIDALEFLEKTGEELLVHLHDVVLGDVGHLEVDLSELGLTVGAEILVAEAAGDLEVSVEAREHQQLLIELRRLGQSVEFSVMYAARDEIVAGSLGSRLDEAGSLDVDEAVLGVVVPGDLYDLASRDDIAGEIRTAQVEIAVL